MNSARSDEPTTSAWASVGDVLKETLVENSGKVEVVTASPGLATAAPLIQVLRRAALASPSGHLRVAAAEAKNRITCDLIFVI